MVLCQCRSGVLQADLIDSDLGVSVVGDARKAEARQVHWVLRQLVGHRERVGVLEPGEPVGGALVLPHRLALFSKYLYQQDLSLNVGHDSCGDRNCDINLKCVTFKCLYTCSKVNYIKNMTCLEVNA